MSQEEFPESIRSLVRGSTAFASTQISSVALIHERSRRRRRTFTLAAMASTFAAVIALVTLLHPSGFGSNASSAQHPDVAAAHPKPGSTSSPTPSPGTSTTPTPAPLQVAAVPLGKAVVSTGPSTPVPLFFGGKLLLPGSRALDLGAAMRYGYAVSPDGTWAAYQVGTQLRTVNFATAEVYDLGTGTDPVWGSSGLAYAVPSQPAPSPSSIPATGLIVVRHQFDAPPVVWAQGQVAPSAWIGTHLLIGRAGKNAGGYVVIQATLVDSPFHERPVADNVTSDFTFVAASPDATRFLIRLERKVTVDHSEYFRPILELVDVKTLKIIQKEINISWASLTEGSWVGSDLYAGLGPYGGGSTQVSPVIYHLRVSNESFQLVRARYLHTEPGRNMFVSIYRLWRVAPDRIAVLRGMGEGTELDTCSLPALICSLQLSIP